MPKRLTLTRPLAVIDLETTGTDPFEDRIVEICVVKILPDGGEDRRCRLINPGRPIPPEATAIHTITDDMVKDAPPFHRVAAGIVEFLDGCDICGYNVARFDLRILVAELERSGKSLPLAGRTILDPMQIFHHYERRDLAAAVRYYLHREHAFAHRAEADVNATIEILHAMIAQYDDLPTTPEQINEKLLVKASPDSDGMFEEGKAGPQFRRGKHKGRLLDDIAQIDREYLYWMIEKGTFMADTLKIVKDALERNRNVNN